MLDKPTINVLDKRCESQNMTLLLKSLYFRTWDISLDTGKSQSFTQLDGEMETSIIPSFF